jgi:hypothetical protein
LSKGWREREDSPNELDRKLDSAKPEDFKEVYLEITRRKISEESMAATITEVFKAFKFFCLHPETFKEVDRAIQKLRILRKGPLYKEGPYEWLAMAPKSLVTFVTSYLEQDDNYRFATSICNAVKSFLQKEFDPMLKEIGLNMPKAAKVKDYQKLLKPLEEVTHSY